MKQMSSPGLPQWPKLWFDAELQLATIVVRHATWRSYEWACWTTEVMVWMVNGIILLGAWLVFETPNIGVRIGLVLVAWIVCTGLASMATRKTFRDPLARFVFATTTTVWATTDSVIFKSRLYVSPVVAWREWKGRPIRFKFVVESDPDAVSYLTDHRGDKDWPRGPINEAAIISLVVTTPSSQTSAVPTNHTNLQRAIPISEVSSRHAQKFSTVFSAALDLVSPKAEQIEQSVNLGVDIDAV